MYIANIPGTSQFTKNLGYTQRTDAGLQASFNDKLPQIDFESSSSLIASMNTDNQSKQRPSELSKHNEEKEHFEDESPRYKEKAFQFSPKYRWSRKKHPLSSRFGTDSFLPCVVLMKKKGRTSPPVAVNVSNIGLSATTAKQHHPPRHTHRRASLGVIKERGTGGEEATWARLSQRRRTSLPTTFHSSRKQTVMSSVLVETSVIADLHTALNELSVASSAGNSDIEKCASRMQKLLKPYRNENLCPSQVVWLHDSISSTSDGSDDEEIARGNRSNFNKRTSSRRQDWPNNDGGVWTTTTSATGLPSHEPGPVKSKRLPKIQKTPSNTPHDSRCSSPISGKDVGSLSRRRTIHNIGPYSPGRSQTFFSSQEESGNPGHKEGKDGRRMFTSSDYESCDNLLTDGSEGETVKQMPDLQQPTSAGRRGTLEGSSHDNEQSPKIRMLITEPTIDEGSEEDERLLASDESTDDEQASSHKSSDCESYTENLTVDGVSPEELHRIFTDDDYKADLLEKVYSWNFPIFELADETHCVLSQMAYKLFDDTGLFATFKIPRKAFVDYMRALENGYRNIPYHNRIHASDVLHGCWYLTTQQIPGFSETSPLFSSDSSDSDSGTAAHTQVNTVGSGSLAQAIPALELMALYLAAAMHDYDHPGRTNAFLVETRHPLAMLYNDRSVLENHHASASWELLHSKPSYDFLVNLDVAEWKRLRFLIVEAILATDLKKHFELMSRFSSKISRRNDASSEVADPSRHEGCLTWTADEDRLLVCQMVIKLADIGGPTKIRDLHVTWTRAICQEFFTQGDEERQLNSPVSPFMDREQPQVAQLQRTFIKNLIAPLVCKMHKAGILAGYVEDGDEKGEEDNILEPTEENTIINCRSLVREQLADNLRYWHSILEEKLKGQDEMDKVFKCCHNVTLEHENYDAVDTDFAKNLIESRRQKLLLHNNNASVVARNAPKSSKKDSTITKDKHRNEIQNFPKINFPPPKSQTELKSPPALCNVSDKTKTRPRLFRKIP
uniref:cGMP-inhibited 3',5'-cyclic phosphodiesterase A-like isoform X2 n=1 Tax=Styela clava TaxID=7725 RepID=UPI001939583F|nr:cGMP-inhibited 3',5'-cyclic phosphodiesterase A-like isoform X2 [Styela clava]